MPDCLQTYNRLCEFLIVFRRIIMNKTNKQFKKYLNKLLANVICLAMLLNIAPLFGFLKVGAEVFYDNSLGNYYENKGILIAEPYENAAFRGWYSKTGEEVSIDKSFVIPSGKTANDYIPVFYNLNLLENPSFEEVSEYSNWFSVTDSSAFEITANEARTGEQALEIIPKNSAVYCDLSGLEKNTQYRIDFNYKAQDSLKFVSVISADEEVNNSANLYDGEFLAQCSQSVLKNNFVASAWNYTSITFFSYEETSVKLALLYEGESFFVDDMALIEDNMTSASYLNNEFDNYNSESEADNLYLNFSNSKPEYTKTEITDSGWLKVASTRNTNIMSSKGILFKKGAKYTFRAKVDISEFEHKYVPKLDNEGNVIYDASGNIVYDQVVNNGQIENMLNWINFTFSTESGNTGSETDDTYVTSGDSQISSEFIVKNEDGYILVHKTSKTSGFGFGIESIKNISDRSNLSITMTFTAEKNCVGYFNIRNNGCETFYIDYITLEENNVDTDIKSVVQNYALKTVGTAIRTEGKQGIRHKTSLDKILLTADNNYGIRFVEYGTLAIKTEYLGENNLVLNGKYVFEGKEYQAKKGVAYSFNSKIDKIFAEGRNTVDFTAVLVNIAEENWNNDYTVRAYFKYQDKNGNIDVIYANPFDVAVYPVAKEAYSAKNEQGGYAETDGVRTYLYKNIITRFTDKIITIKDNT
ncbi:MAG: hypothetical protein J6D52_09500, partial [Clostridia bacterium]|nr:hypothetical protein [Clostridia bacterium]